MYFEIILCIIDRNVGMHAKIELHGIFQLAMFAKLVYVSQFTFHCKNNSIVSIAIETQKFNRTYPSRDYILNHSVFAYKRNHFRNITSF